MEPDRCGLFIVWLVDDDKPSPRAKAGLGDLLTEPLDIESVRLGGLDARNSGDFDPPLPYSLTYCSRLPEHLGMNMKLAKSDS
jgi:hypothetical protein